MKGKRMFLGIVTLCAVLIMAQASVSNAYTYDGAWLPNDTKDFFAVKLTVGTPPSAFSMYDWKDTDSLQIFGPSATFDADTVYFTLDSGTWYASLTKGAITDLNLGTSLEFGFFFSDGSATSHFSYDVQVDDPGEQYVLSHTDFGTIAITSDIAPVPIPASALLFGSGMVGLIGFGKRMRKKVF